MRRLVFFEKSSLGAVKIRMTWGESPKGPQKEPSRKTDITSPGFLNLISLFEGCTFTSTCGRNVDKKKGDWKFPAGDEGFVDVRTALWRSLSHTALPFT